MKNLHRRREKKKWYFLEYTIIPNESLEVPLFSFFFNVLLPKNRENQNPFERRNLFSFSSSFSIFYPANKLSIFYFYSLRYALCWSSGSDGLSHAPRLLSPARSSGVEFTSLCLKDDCNHSSNAEEEDGETGLACSRTRERTISSSYSQSSWARHILFNVYPIHRHLISTPTHTHTARRQASELPFIIQSGRRLSCNRRRAGLLFPFSQAVFHLLNPRTITQSKAATSPPL